MVRRMALLALVSGCGSVESKPDAQVPRMLGSLADGCGVLLPMDERAWGGAGSVIDECGGNNNGTPSGNINPTDDDQRGRVGSFLGNGCIEVADAPELRPSTAFTLSAWVRPTALNDSDAYGVISKRLDMEAQSAYSLFLWTEDNAWISIEGNDNRFQNRATLANDRWNQVTVTYDGARPAAERVRWYVDGLFDIAGAETAASIMPYTAPLKIGCLPSAETPQNFVGLLDDVAVWTRALSEAEITSWHALTK